MDKEQKDLNTEFETFQSEFVRGFALSGDAVKELSDKGFIIQKHRYEKSPDLDNPGQLKEKLVLTVELADGQQVDWYPNKTSQRSIIVQKGYRLDDWVGFHGTFMTKSQRVGKSDKEVIYVEE